jgi:hypothetical protein
MTLISINPSDGTELARYDELTPEQLEAALAAAAGAFSAWRELTIAERAEHLLKHASKIPGCAIKVEETFRRVGPSPATSAQASSAQASSRSAPEALRRSPRASSAWASSQWPGAHRDGCAAPRFPRFRAPRRRPG